MKSSLEPLEGNKVKLYVEVDEAEFDRDIDQAFKAIAREVNCPGSATARRPAGCSRPASASAPPASRRCATRSRATSARPSASTTSTSSPLRRSRSPAAEEGTVEFEAECEVRPEVTVPGYGGLRIELDAIEPTDDEIDEAERRRAPPPRFAQRRRPPGRVGDFLTIDLAATRDGEEVLGLNTEDFSYELGKGWVTDDFDDQLTGASAGDELTFTSTPKGTEEPADFTVTVKSVQELDLPELTDEWVAENIGEFDTVEEWPSVAPRADQRAEAQPGPPAVHAASSPRRSPAWSTSSRPSRWSTPRCRRGCRTPSRSSRPRASTSSVAVGHGPGPQRVLRGLTRAGGARPSRLDLALRAVANAEEIEVGDDELDMEYARMAMQFGQKARDIRAYEQNDAVPELIAQIRKSKAIDWLLHHVEMVDTDGQSDRS